MKIAYQGIKGSYSESCAQEMYPECETIACKTFDDVFNKASKNEEVRAIAKGEYDVIKVVPDRGEEAEKEIKQIEKHTGLPTTDFVRFGPSKIWNLIKKG